MVKEKISILIPAFNEEENIIPAINETIEVFKKLELDYELIIIDDGSIDNTYKKVQESLHTFNGRVKIERYELNAGKGYAIKYGFNFVSGDYILFLDADLDLHPSQITNFLKLMEEYKADVVMGSKRHKDSVVNYPKSRKILSNGYYFLIKILFGLPVKDTQTGLKLFRYEALKNSISKIVIKRYAFDLELLVVLYKLGYKIVECPIYLKPTRRYYNRIGLKDIYHMLMDTLAIFYRLYIKKYYK
ncbi:MAG: glycosyltransferase family 2 protein [Cyanobacteria bacterium]|nr:glycosyltransferase family 2 protein [Cyanobacteriota bacterium]